MNKSILAMRTLLLLKIATIVRYIITVIIVAVIRYLRKRILTDLLWSARAKVVSTFWFCMACVIPIIVGWQSVIWLRQGFQNVRLLWKDDFFFRKQKLISSIFHFSNPWAYLSNCSVNSSTNEGVEDSETLLLCLTEKNGFHVTNKQKTRFS